MTNKIKGLRFGLFCKRKKAVPRVYVFINRRACCGCFHWSINRGYYTRVFLAPIVFVWNDFVRSFCFYLYNLDERIQTFEGCILNVWICIHKEAIQVRIYISVPALEEGWGWGSMTEGVVETGNAELWSTLSVHDYSPWSVSMNLWKLNGWIADKVNISTQINKRSFGKKNVDFYCAIINIRIFNYSLPVFFSLGGGVAGGFVSTSEVINYGGSCGKVSLDSD